MVSGSRGCGHEHQGGLHPLTENPAVFAKWTARTSLTGANHLIMVFPILYPMRRELPGLPAFPGQEFVSASMGSCAIGEGIRSGQPTTGATKLDLRETSASCGFRVYAAGSVAAPFGSFARRWPCFQPVALLPAPTLDRVLSSPRASCRLRRRFHPQQARRQSRISSRTS